MSVISSGWIILISSFIVVYLAVSTVSSDNIDIDKHNNDVGSFRAVFKLPKMFDFEHFEQMFHRNYGTLVEEMARRKLFLGRAFQAFISSIKYKHGLIDYYLGINPTSDWTREERETISVKRELIFMGNKTKLTGSSQADNDVYDDDEIPVANIEDIQREIKYIVEKHSNEPVAKEIVEELSSRGARIKRSTRERDISSDDFEPKNRKKLKKTDRAESDEANYEIAKAKTKANSDNLMPFSVANKIFQLPGISYLNSVVRKTLNVFSPYSEHLPVIGHKAGIVYKDHTDSGCLSQPRDQIKCGSCYAFSTITALEWHYCQTTGRALSFSEQYLVDCGSRVDGHLRGCNGGNVGSSLMFAFDYGLELRSHYPYEGVTGQCPYKETTDPDDMGYIRLDDIGNEIMEYPKSEELEQIIERELLLVSLAVPPTFWDYKGGVDPGLICNKKSGHGVVLIGHGRQDGEEYWLLRNSHGIHYGERGNYKLNKKSKCIEEAIRVTNFKVTSDEDGPKRKYQSDAIKKRYHKTLRKQLS